MPPVVSVVIPVFNRPALVSGAIRSALAAGSAIDLEVIVVDDCSTDDTWEVLRALDDDRVRPMRLLRNSGQSAARNHGLEQASGTWVKFLDSDDILEPGHLARELEAVRSAEAEIGVAGWREVFDDGARAEFPAPRFASIVDDVLAGKGVPTSAALYVRREDWRWDPGLRKLDDWDYFSQAALGASRIATADGIAYSWRQHAGARVSAVSMLANAREHHHILHKIEQRLAAEGRLTAPRRLRLAQYFYKELRVLSLHDRAAFERALAHIHELDPRFVPRDEERQWWMRALARVLGTKRAVLLHAAVKKGLGRS